MKRQRMEKGGYYTVEAVFIVTICIWVLMAILYSGLYVHDRMVVISEMNQKLAEKFQRGDGEGTLEWQDEARQSIANKLMLMRIKKIKVKKGALSAEMTVTYDLPVSLRGIKSLFGGGRQYMSLAVAREIVNPVKYKWDYDILTGKGGR